MKRIASVSLLILILSCQNKESNNEIYKLAVQPRASVTNNLSIINETTFIIEVDGNSVENSNKSILELNYSIQKDTTGNLVVNMNYNRLQLHTKNGETETSYSSDNAAVSNIPVEKMLGLLKKTKLSALITPSGQIKEVRGFKELGDSLISGFNPNDTYGRTMALQQWQTIIKQKLVDDNLTQLFRIFPDSTIKVGDEWTIPEKHNEHFDFTVLNKYRLEEIEDNIAIISVKGDIKIENGKANALGVNAIANLNGTISGEYKIDINTGLPVENNVETNIEGKVNTMGREVPITITSKVSIEKIN